MAEATEDRGEQLDIAQLFHALYVHMAEGVALHELICDDQGTPTDYRILAVNPRYETYTGLVADAVVGKLGSEAYGTGTAPYLDEYASVCLGGAARRFETHFPPLDRYYEISVAPVGSRQFATIFLDITARKKGERALSARTTELDQFFKLAIDLLCIASLDGRFLRVNAAWTEALGWTVAELEGRPYLELVHPEDQADTIAAMQALAGGRRVASFTNRYRARDGGYRFIEWRSSVAAGERVYAAARDVTSRIAADRALRVSEERFRRIFEVVPSPLTLADADGTLVECNRAFCTTTGYARDELLGRRIEDLRLWPDPEMLKSVIAELKQKGEINDFEFQSPRKDGTLRTIVLSARQLMLDGQPVTLASAQDITEKRSLEQQMLHSQKLESLGVLAGGIAHDFNNLLTGVLGNADLATRELPPASPAVAHLEAIGTSARRAAELCRQLLAYSGKGRFLVQPLDLAELVEEMGHLLAVSMSKKVVLQYHFAKQLPTVQADATQIRQVVMNLIVNASEAIGDRTGVISVSTSVVACDARYLDTCYSGEQIAPGRFVALDVADTGRGMDRATRERIFDPFFSTKFTGRGLGLAAVLGIVRGHHGAIRVYSEVGRGTTFRLLFPAADEAPPAVTRAPDGGASWRGQGLVLLVDDDEAIRQVGRRMLELAGLSVVTASDGREAVALYEEQQDRVALVVLDLTMPRMDGEACFRALRQIRPDVKVLLSSGYNEQDVVSQFAGRGLAGFVQKPFTSEDLLSRVRAVLG